MGERHLGRTKRIVELLWILMVVLTLGGCMGATESPEDAMLYPDEVKDNDDYIVVGFSQVGAESDWRAGNTESFRSVFTEENGYFLLYEDAQQKQENQLKAIRNFILQEVDYIRPYCGDWMGCSLTRSKRCTDSSDPGRPLCRGGG